MKSFPVVLIFGPTAVGKTDLLLSPVFSESEIVSADSMQVYRGMDIGTAKPDHAFLAKVKHHLIDILDPSQQFHAGDFVDSADRLVAEIHLRGHFPVICGGTGFYFRNFIYGLPEAPPSDGGIRQMLEAELALIGPDAMYERLRRQDPVSAGRINPNDHYRVLRALEVGRTSGRPLSSFEIPDKPRSGFNILLIGLMRERDEIYDRINRRVDIMMQEGLQAEFESLVHKGYGPEAPGMKGIGYREFFDFNNGTNSMERTVELIKRNSRRYAKRQITYFRQLPGIKWFAPDDIRGISTEVDAFINKYRT